MKKILSIILLCSACFVGMRAQHIEYKWHGIYGVVDYAYMTNVNPQSDKTSLNGFSGICGFQFRKESGIGLGISYVSDPAGAFTQLPIFVELRSHYLESRLTPFTAIQAGYTIPSKTSNGGSEAITIQEGGVTFAFIAGGRFAITRTFGVNLYVGYHLMFMNQVERCHYGQLAENMPTLFHNVKFGMGFNF